MHLTEGGNHTKVMNVTATATLADTASASTWTPASQYSLCHRPADVGPDDDHAALSRAEVAAVHEACRASGSSLFRMHAREVPAAAGGRYRIHTCRGGQRPWTRGHSRGCSLQPRAPPYRVQPARRDHIPVRVEVTDDQARLRLGQFLPDPSHPVNAGGLEPGDVSGVPDADSSLVICREPIENGHVHILIVAALSGALVPVMDRSLGMGRPAWSMRRRGLHQLFHAVNTLSEGSRRAPGLPLRKSSLVRSVPDSDDLAVVAGVLNLPN